MTVKHRENRLPWNDYWCLQAILISLRSPDNSTQVGSILVKNNHLISSGYNGAPKGIHPASIPWEREGDFGQTKYEWVSHSEESCILHAKQDVNGTDLFCTLHPCNNCMKLIINAGVHRVFYLDDKYNHTKSCKIAEKMAELTNTHIIKYEWQTKEAEEISNFILGVK